MLERFLDEWELTPDGDPVQGDAGLTIPVRTAQRQRALLKIATPDPETEHEALALQHWHGRGAVRLIRANPRQHVLLLERLTSTDLSDHWDVQACEIVGGLYRQLHIEAPPQLRLLSSYVATLADRFQGLERGVPLPPRLIDQARSLARGFGRDADTDGRLVHGDLHYGTVLAVAAGEGEDEWKAVDPKPLSGDPHYEVAPLLLNRFDELAGRVREGTRDRFFAAIDAAGLDEQRAKDWVVVRMMDLGIAHPEWATRCVAIAKAVQD
ncbi:aminoglycoside phosphotransferase family protein [Nocardioides sp. Kera G14]|uniref:aminoglycoside phosphotransferase family protein n=1 Tax=Nocardioides sp. Kera G14 TaxID=2884264 RepID=UPI001D1217AB|nr:aminoglycoside phosphotransferase family protein [Nocardioides sp. Kera G14]UDY24820.1 aminoglycoside phosphotransferase family protein [Nocardioides sp. Kera G14]